MEDELKEKRQSVIDFIKKNKNYIYLLILIIVLLYAVKIRVANLPLLVDVTTNDYTTADPDAALYLRYTKYIVEHGSLMSRDDMRYVPLGLNTIQTNPIVAYAIAYTYKVMHFFDNSVTVAKADVLYPVIFFLLA